MSVARNIAERKKVEQEMLQAYREIREIFDLAADGMCVINREYEVVCANKTFARLCGMDINDTLGHEIGDKLLQQVAYRLRAFMVDKA